MTLSPTEITGIFMLCYYNCFKYAEMTITLITTLKSVI